MDDVEARLLAEAVASIYEAAAEPGRWPAALAACARVVSADCGALFVHDFTRHDTVAASPGGLFEVSGFDAAAVQAYLAHYGQVNVWVRAEDRLVPGLAVTSSQLYRDDRLFDTEFGCDWLRPQGLQHALGGVLQRDGDRASKISLLRSASHAPYGERERALMQLLMSHVKRALALQRRTQGEVLRLHGATAVLDRLQHGLVWLDAAGRVQHANRAARALLAGGRALKVDAAGRLRAEARRDAQLQRLLRAALEVAAAPAVLRLPGPTGVVDVHVTGLPERSPHALDGQVALLAILCDPARAPVQQPDMLRALYGMTGAEVRLTAELCAGTTLEQAAERFGVSMNTVRSQLRSAAGKAGVSRQADLVRVVLAGPAGLVAG